MKEREICTEKEMKKRRSLVKYKTHRLCLENKIGKLERNMQSKGHFIYLIFPQVPAAELCSGGFSHLSEINSKTINFYFKSYKKNLEKNI